MLTQVAEGVYTHQSAFCQSNAVIVHGPSGALLVDAGITRAEMDCLAHDLDAPIVAGFATHPHWDHTLWHPGLGDAPRYGTARCTATIQAAVADPGLHDRLARMIPPDIINDVPLDQLGQLTALPAGTTHLPWDGPSIRLLEHQAHAPGHAALLIEQTGVLIAGDMLSDILIPMLNLNGAPTPTDDYLAALQLLEDQATVVIPGHGSVGHDVTARIEQDRAYLYAVQKGHTPDDPRLGPAPAYDWVPALHERQLQALAG